MNKSSLTHAQLSDRELVTEVSRLVALERQSTAKVISALAELDARRLYLGQGCSSMFTYCTQVLHLAEHAAYNRIEAARAARRFPLILAFLAEGRVHLTAVRLLAPHLTETDHGDVLREASHKSKREVEQIVARLQPRPDVPASVRKVPSTTVVAASQPMGHESELDRLATTATAEAPAPRRSEIQPLAPERYKVQFTVGRETYNKLRRVSERRKKRNRVSY